MSSTTIITLIKELQFNFLMMSYLEAIRRLREEYADLTRNPISEFRVIVSVSNEQDITKWYCVFIAPPDTSYKDGMFKVKLTFPENYPSHPPRVKFITPIYHVNVLYKHFNYYFDIGTPFLRIVESWRPEYKVRDILISIFSLFYMHNINCFYERDFVSEVRNNKNLYNEKIKYFTKKYAEAHLFDKYSNTNEDNWDFSYNV